MPFMRFDQQIRLTLELDPVEDGYTHPADAQLEEFIQENKEAAGDWLFDILSGSQWNHSLTASLLRVLSRLQPYTEDWRSRVIRLALSSTDIELRDAAVQAAESWGGPAIIEILQGHAEPSTWLGDYIKRVISNLLR